MLNEEEKDGLRHSKKDKPDFIESTIKGYADRLGKNMASVITIGSIAAGAVHGYCDSQGIPFEKKNLEWALTYSPSIIQAGIVGTTLGLIGIIIGGLKGNSHSSDNDSKSVVVAKTVGGAAVGAVAGTAAGSALGAAVGGLETAIGYGLGYFAGFLAR